MKTQFRSTHRLVDEQVRRWQLLEIKGKPSEEAATAVTVSREPGSGGRLVAEGIARELGFDLFHREIVQKMAEDAKISRRVLETLDESKLSILEDWLSTLVNERHLWPDQYLQHLMKVIGTIGRHGNAVIVGRGGNFILPPEGQCRLRIVCPLEIRVQNVADEFGVPATEAKSRIIRTESERRAFVRKYFHADIAEPVNYDLVINTGRLSIDNAVKAAVSVIG